MRNKRISQTVKFLNKTLPIKITNGKFHATLLFLALAAFGVKFHAAPQTDGDGGVDPNFNIQVQTNSFSTKEVSAMLALPDDKMVVVGTFNSFNRQPTSGLIRLTADGLLDPTFNNNLLAANAVVNKLYLQPDGKILIAGYKYKLNGSSAFAPSLLRLNADGTVDSTFNFFYGSDFPVYAVAVGTDGKIWVSGGNSLIRLNSDGTKDNSFNYSGSDSVTVFTLQNNNPVIVINNYTSSQDFVIRLSTDGSIDSSFTRIVLNSYIRVLKTAPDNKILVLTDQNLRRFNENGTSDNGFQTSTTIGEGRFVHIGSDGRITYATRTNANPVMQIRRILTDGTPDPTFTTYNYIGSGVLAFQSDDEIFIGDITITTNGTSIINQYTHLFANGTVDTTFNPGGVGFQMANPGKIEALIVQPNQKIIMAGKFDIINDVNRSKIARLNTDNTIDNSFQVNTGATGNRFSRIGEIYTLSAQPNDKIIVTGAFDYIVNGAGKVNVVRLNSDGSIDPTFNVGVHISDYYGVSGAGKNKTATQSDGKILIATSRISSTDSTVIPTRLNSDGSRDTTFNFLYNSAAYAYDVAVQPDQKILVSGINLTNQVGFITRLNVNGGVDQSFRRNEESGKVIAHFNLLADGKILIIKGGFGYYSSSQVTVSRLNADGSPDATFAVGTGANGHINATALLPNGQLLIGGKFTTFDGQARQNLALINPNGSLAPTTYNVNQEVSSLAVDGSGRILVGGSFTVINVNNGQNYARSYVARLTAPLQAKRTRFDFDGDGRADLATFTASSGIWSILASQNSQISATQFGQNADKYAPADYDNDGKTDIAVYRPANGNWYLMQSTAGFAAIQWGAAEDKPVAADYDGDGKSELAVWRPSNGIWYILRNSSQFAYYQFGVAGDIPVTADYDGDGKSDIAVFRPSNGTFYWLASASNNQFNAVQFGQNSDIPAVADYNGDGKADLVVFRPSNGVWYQYLTGGGGNFTFSAVQFGQNGDEPAAADYDGDGKADIAVRRQSVWYLLQSAQGFSGISFGSVNSPAVASVPIQ
jgi:uncharacterized delta-60 repeat protein